MEHFFPSLRVAAVTIAVCVVVYAAAILTLAQLCVPGAAGGSLIRGPDGALVGSRRIAQEFTRPGNFWPRPSAVGFDASAAGGSNKSPTSRELAQRAEALAAQYGASPTNPLPPELAAASGSGLDPHISARAARYQAERVAAARGLEGARVEALIEELAFAPAWPLGKGRLVNVLELNLALEREAGAR